jgi:hypothetical protein
MHARGLARDNELFVVIAALAGQSAVQQGLVEVIGVCRAARHRVIVVDSPAARPSLHIGELDASLVADALGASDSRQDERFRKELTRMGVPYARLDDPRLVQMAVAEIELIRAGRGRVSGQRMYAY